MSGAGSQPDRTTGGRVWCLEPVSPTATTSFRRVVARQPCSCRCRGTPGHRGQALDRARERITPTRRCSTCRRPCRDTHPLPELRAFLADVVQRPDTSGYAPVAGLAHARDAIVFGFRVRLRRGRPGVPADDVMVTTGCNQAFCLAIGVLCSRGDDVVLPTPYYFNHHMWLRACGITPVPLALSGERGTLPYPTAVERSITERTWAVVLVTPNNPCGVVYPPDLIEAVSPWPSTTVSRSILDEIMYKDFRTTTDPPYSLFARPDWRDALVHLYSFSKMLSLAGLIPPVHSWPHRTCSTPWPSSPTARRSACRAAGAGSGGVRSLGGTWPMGRPPAPGDVRARAPPRPCDGGTPGWVRGGHLGRVLRLRAPPVCVRRLPPRSPADSGSNTTCSPSPATCSVPVRIVYLCLASATSTIDHGITAAVTASPNRAVTSARGRCLGAAQGAETTPVRLSR